MTGFIVFIAADVTALAAGAWGVRQAALLLGRQVAAVTAFWLALSLGAYTGICLWLGYGWGAQTLAALVAAVFAVPVALSGRASIRAIPHNPAPVDREGEADG